MIVPGKFTTFSESVLAQLPHILACIKEPTTVHDLYQMLVPSLDEPDVFIYALDILYVLDRINLDTVTGTIHRC